MNLHIMPDEKVVTRAIQSFDSVLPNQNKYVIIIPQNDYKCKHVKIEAFNIYKVVFDTNIFWEIIGNPSQYKQIVIHFMTDEAVAFINKIEHPNITWMTWGADLYNELLIKRGFPLYADPLIIFKGIRLMRYIRYLKHMLVNDKENLNERLNAVKKVGNMCVNDGDYKLLQKYYPEVGEKCRKRFFYYPIDEIIPNSLIESTILGNDIMVGNSAALTNNHVSVYKRLSKLSLKDRRVISPLSYGDDFRETVKEGRKVLGDRFVPLIDFMPLEEYNRLLLNVRTFIFGSYRQQAMGNIVVALFLGATVFLDKRNTIMQRLQEMGCVLFSIDELEEKIDYKLSESEISQNRMQLLKNYSKEMQKKYIQDYFS